MMILDPCKDGVTMYLDDKVRFFDNHKFSTMDIFNEILNYIILVEVNDNGDICGMFQHQIPYLDTKGVGAIYMELFDEYEVKYKTIKTLPLSKNTCDILSHIHRFPLCTKEKHFSSSSNDIDTVLDEFIDYINEKY